MDFEHFNKTLISTMGRPAANDSKQLMKIYDILYREIDVEDIDFNAFTYEDIQLVVDTFEDHIYYDDDSGEDFLLLDSHPISLLDSMENVVSNLNNTPKIKPKSKFKFL
ncbi:hypothetical protein LG296_19725 (plasmid) [Ureibacillus chungkukjangi]|uniref:hypothetical protein n=1 Tax=Ureibacillus chungkukjangi TaxID=1202712 RepID=UPI000D3BA555|nr:hypothetical protein [Ureibacillus chungkukjangi]MCM3390539.1 hypothetical protein [Ureibacillus chungkukjangi]